MKATERLEQEKKALEAIKFDVASKIRLALCTEEGWTCSWSDYTGDWLIYKEGLDPYLKQGGCRESQSPRGLWTAYCGWKALGFTIEHPLLDTLRDIEHTKREREDVIEAMKPKPKDRWYMKFLRAMGLINDGA